MANAQTTVELIFQGVDKTAAATQAALENMGKLSGGIKDATQPIADFSVGALKLEAGLLAAGAGLTVFAIKVAGDFDTAFRQISTLFEANDEDLARFRTNIQEYASGSSKSIEDIMNALGAALGIGVDYKESLDLIAISEKLAVATKADLKSTTEVLLSTIKAYGLETSDAGRVSDLLFQIIKDGKIEMNDLSRSLAQITPIAAATGISIEEVGAAIAVLTGTGMQPSSAIDALKSAISNIVKPSEQARDLAKELGIEFDVNALKSKGLAGVLADVALKTQGSADKMAILFGDVTGLGAVLALTGPQAQKFGETIGSMGNSAGSVAEAYKKMAGSLEASSQQVRNAFEVMLASIGTPLLDEAGGIAKAIAKIFEAIGASVRDGKLGGLVDYIGSVMKEIQDSLEAVARNLPAALEKADLGRFQEGIKSVIDAFKTLFGNIDLTTVDGLAAGINLAGTAFLGLSRYVAGVIESFKPLFDQLVKVGSGLADVDTSFLEILGNIGGFVTQLNILSGALAALATVMTAKQLIDLLGGLRLGMAGAALAAPGLVAALGPTGLALAASSAAPAIYQLALSFWELKKARDQVSEAQARGREIEEKAIPSLELFARSTGFAVKSLDEADAIINKGLVVFDEATGLWVKASKAQIELAEAAKKSVPSFEEQNMLMLASSKYTQDAAAGVKDLYTEQGRLMADGTRAVPILDSVTGAIVGWQKASNDAEEAVKKLGTTTDKNSKSAELSAEAAQKAALETAKLGVELEKLASNERIKLIEARVQLNVAELQADTERVKAAFTSLDNTVTSTGELLGDLFSTWDSGDLSSKGRAIEDQIELENERREKALELQEKLTEAQIKALQARANAIQRGDALIKIEGDGLKPHLEAFMWEILRSIQVRVNQDGLDLLVGA